MTSIARRWLSGRKDGPVIVTEDCPTFDMIKVQSVILSYVVAEDHQEETARELIDWYIFEYGDERAEVVASVLEA